MNVFQFHRHVVERYARFTRSFTAIRAGAVYPPINAMANSQCGGLSAWPRFPWRLTVCERKGLFAEIHRMRWVA